MKSEHRHELETNELSASLAKWIENLKPYSGQLLTGLAVLMILYLGFIIWGNKVAQNEMEAWDAFALATDTSDVQMASLQRVAGDEQYAGTKMSEWAYVGWADRQVLNAMSFYLVDREKTKDLLRNVEGIYQGFAKNASDPQVMNRARFGLARVYELQDKLDEARQQYLTVRGDLQPQAEERAQHLETEDVREAYAWLATAELPKRDLTGGQGATGERPNFDATLPSADSPRDSISAKSLEELLGNLEAMPSGEDSSEATSEQPAEEDEAEDSTSLKQESEAEDSEVDTDDAAAE